MVKLRPRRGAIFVGCIVLLFQIIRLTKVLEVRVFYFILWEHWYPLFVTSYSQRISRTGVEKAGRVALHSHDSSLLRVRTDYDI